MPRTDLLIVDWVCRIAPGGGRSAHHPDGTGFSCTAITGLAATCNQQRALPPTVPWWLVQPIAEDKDAHY
jgi:hypothetical protein